MTAKVIQGWFLGQPKLPPAVPARLPPPPIQAKTAARPPGPPAPAFAGRQGAVQRHGAGDAFAVEAGQLGLASGGGRPLPDAVRGKMEAALGANFSDVRVHVGPQAERIGAIAFTVGSDIYFAPGRFQPDNAHGQQLLGHELAHVVQQRAGRVRNPLGAGLAVVQDHALEAEADRLGWRAATLGALQMKPRRPAIHQRPGAVQRQIPNGAWPLLPAPAWQPRPTILQRCARCLNPACVRGELCGYDHTHGGLFPTPALVVPYNQARNHPSGGTMEFEHPIAGAALRASGVPHNYRDEYTIQTPTGTHRAAMSGGGGGITSTGSSTTARRWANELGGTLANDPRQAVQDAAIEQINAHWMHQTLDGTAVSGVVQWVQAQVPNRIGQVEADNIIEYIMGVAAQRGVW